MAARLPTTAIPEPAPELPAPIRSALERSRELGLFGDGPLEPQIRHAAGFAGAGDAPPASFLDMGAGGGLPGLVLGVCWPRARIVLLDSSARRCEVLRQAVDAAGWQDRVRVVEDRAERAGRDAELRSSQGLVVARSFGPPAVLAECAAPFLQLGGLLIVSEPPAGDDAGISEGSPVGHPERWPAEGLSQFGLVVDGFVRGEFGYQRLRQVEPCPDRFPRRDGVPAKKPIF